MGKKKIKREVIKETSCGNGKPVIKTMTDYIKQYASWVIIEKGISRNKIRKIAEALTADVIKKLVKDQVFHLILKQNVPDTADKTTGKTQKHPDTLAVKVNVIYGEETKYDLKQGKVPNRSSVNLPGVVK